MAGLAPLREAPTMGVFVAIRAQVERNASISSLIVRSQRMTFRARDLSVQASQGITRPRVIELFNVDCSPAFKTVALLTGRPKAATVRILMACRTGRR